VEEKVIFQLQGLEIGLIVKLTKK